MGRRAQGQLILNEAERQELLTLTARRKTAQALALRAHIILSCAQGLQNKVVAQRHQVTQQTVGRWRSRYIEQRLDGLLDAPRSGAPRTIDDTRVEAVIAKTLESRPAGATHWSTRTMAREMGLTQTAVSRIWRAFGLQPHRQETFKLPTDPMFVDKVRDIVGLYLAPPLKALVLCVDEKSQIQALDRTQPILPLAPGIPERRTHDYERHGTTTLFAALNVLNGAVLAACKPRHRHQEFLSFLREIDKAMPAELDIHCIVDNYATHSHPKIKAWLAARPRWHMHFIPTYSSWLNQVERFFSLITDKAIRRGSFTSVKQLVQRIDHFITAHNANCQPFKWIATADSILEKLYRLCSRISGTGH